MPIAAMMSDRSVMADGCATATGALQPGHVGLDRDFVVQLLDARLRDRLDERDSRLVRLGSTDSTAATGWAGALVLAR